jgi:hypothetical protein
MVVSFLCTKLHWRSMQAITSLNYNTPQATTAATSPLPITGPTRLAAPLLAAGAALPLGDGAVELP